MSRRYSNGRVLLTVCKKGYRKRGMWAAKNADLQDRENTHKRQGKQSERTNQNDHAQLHTTPDRQHCCCCSSELGSSSCSDGKVWHSFCTGPCLCINYWFGLNEHHLLPCWHVQNRLRKLGSQAVAGGCSCGFAFAPWPQSLGKAAQLIPFFGQLV